LLDTIGGREVSEKKIEWGKELVHTVNDFAGLPKDLGIPGIGFIARFA
jgi:hypothetical protein